MEEFKCYDWDGNLIKSQISDLKEAVQEALKHGCEVHDQNGDIVFSQWDGWNGDYPSIEKLAFPVADMEMVSKAKQFLMDTQQFHDWCKFEAEEFQKWIVKAEWLHSDRWSATYDWVYNGKFSNIPIPEDIVTCLVEYWETNALHLKVGV